MNEWFATLIDDLKFLGAECKREFLDLEIRPMTSPRWASGTLMFTSMSGSRQAGPAYSRASRKAAPAAM